MSVIIPASNQGRIAVVSHAHPSVSKGGAEISAYSLYTGLKQLGMDCVFIAACPNEKRHRLVLSDENEHVITYSQSEYSSFYHVGAPRVVTELEALLDRLDVSVVNFHHFLGFGVDTLATVRTAQRRVFFTIHEFLALCHHHGQMITTGARSLCSRSSPEPCAECFPDISVGAFAMRQRNFLSTFNQLDGFISPSRFLRDRFAAWGLPPERIEIIENGLIQNRTPRPPRPETGRWVLGYFGQINPFKGVDLLLEAFERLVRTAGYANRVTLRIHGNKVGELGRTDKLLNDLTASGLVDYRGPYRNTEVVDLMSDCHYVVVPSRWWENSPVVIQEAYLAGCPVIAADVGGMAEKVVKSVSGFHFKFGDSGSLASILLAALEPAVYRKLVESLPSAPNSLDMAKS
jgi:glycosyltransferase involved in cell wall biosynthesis